MRGLLVSFVAILGVCFQANASLIQVGSNNVGDIDTFIGQNTNLQNSNPNTELAWLQSVTNNYNLSFFNKTEDLSYQSTNTTDVIAFELFANSTAQYFIVKNTRAWAIFENNAEFNWGVVDLNDLASPMNLKTQGGEISHVSYFGITVSQTNVPTPSVFTMFLLALACLRLRKV
ncbi:hypothetical protein ISG33_12600 [Glaciecola sp. MH2013]|uniref:hypothetical protein n=1 Tax=Glaciecola sp. MH2013 TaxID=2785524 RepID=UPI00189EE861|nr:hypothetical protein [Glaciecola sp. MH2013]MBF7074239.1 hypothetical protein [Glaciecola sp. MH2013]